MIASFASSPRLPLIPQHPHERRFTVALLCSGVLHAVLATVATVLIALSPAPAPQPSADRPALLAVLQDARPATPELPQATLAPVPELLPDPVLEPMLVEKPAAPAPRIPPAVPAPAPKAVVAPDRGPITSSDPNGNVTVGMLEQPALLGPGIASRLAERYPVKVDRPPRMMGAMIVAYPPAARQAHASARISAVLDIDERGRVVSVALVPDHAWFGPSVTQALRDARFQPAEVATNRVPYWAIVEFVFAIAPAAAASANAGDATAAAPSPALQQRAGAESGASVN